MDALAKLVALCLTSGVGGVTLSALLDRFEDVEGILAASEADLCAVRGIGPRTAQRIRQVDVAGAKIDLVSWRRDGINVLRWDQPRYPLPLCNLELCDRPPILFCRGTLADADKQAVAIVGTRNPTPSSKMLAGRLGFELAKRGWTVISGLAWGIDSATHEGAIQAGKRTIAVLGSGVRHPLPEPRQTLAARIVMSGMLLSEVHPDSAPSPAALVARNRLISGLSRAVIVVEAGSNSGSLYAARNAIRQGRALFAVDNGSAGNTALIKEGAMPLAANFQDWDDLDDKLGTLA